MKITYTGRRNLRGKQLFGKAAKYKDKEENGEERWGTN